MLDQEKTAMLHRSEIKKDDRPTANITVKLDNDSDPSRK